ncbi:hypothetical protein HPP92_016646 [Vanilla planifolia]|uniref:Uncharacterized protein n=1 Tax=Vanilla planifolia TaxID=51239 RepID=A0A835QF65_VANPL|nr:hypothetical protein HPP92_016646 [Vanilla planifolia]
MVLGLGSDAISAEMVWSDAEDTELVWLQSGLGTKDVAVMRLACRGHVGHGGGTTMSGSDVAAMRLVRTGSSRRWSDRAAEWFIRASDMVDAATMLLAWRSGCCNARRWCDCGVVWSWQRLGYNVINKELVLLRCSRVHTVHVALWNEVG